MSAPIVTVPCVPTATDKTATALGLAGGALGVLAGIIELSLGSSIRSWIGEKQDPSRLGVVTIALALVALTSSLVLRRRRQTTAPRRVLLGLGQLLPGLVGFTTVGRLWWMPGALLLAAGVVTIGGARGHGREVLVAAERNWTAVLTAALGVVYVALGLAAGSWPGALGIAGGVATIALVAERGRIPRSVALALLVVAVVPFAAATWTSVVTPILAILIVILGGCGLAPSRSSRYRVA